MKKTLFLVCLLIVIFLQGCFIEDNNETIHEEEAKQGIEHIIDINKDEKNKEH
jgi:outer membrane lipoprotein-sorting protein